MQRFIHEHYNLTMYDGQTKNLYKIIDYSNRFWNSEWKKLYCYGEIYKEIKDIEVKIVPLQKQCLKAFDSTDNSQKSFILLITIILSQLCTKQ